jgi:hypothetical protein
MLQYFEFLKFDFITNFIIVSPSNDLVILMIYVIFSTSVFLSLLKLIYEMNLKVNLAVQISTLFNDLVNLAVIVFVTLL